MLKWFTTIWVAGLLTLVPYSIWYLLFDATTSDEYAFFIVFPLFWIFGYWGVLGPLIAAWKVRRFMNALDQVNNGEELTRLIRSEESKDTAIELLASETHLPKFIARRLYEKLSKRLAEKNLL